MVYRARRRKWRTGWPRIAIETLGRRRRASPPIWPSPKGTPKGAIVVIQEIFGVNRGHPRANATIGPSLGYLGVAPDLFWRLEPGVELDPDVPEQFQQALGLMQQLRPGQGASPTSRRRSATRARRLPERRQGRRGRLLPRRPARLHDRGAHRRRRLGRLLWRRPRGAAGREARHRPAAACSTSPAPTIS